MTVGGGSNVAGYGTVSVLNAGSGALLLDDTFELNSTTYTISGLIAQNGDSMGAQEDLFFKVDAGMIPEKNDLVLQLDSRELAFSDAFFTVIASANAYLWNNLSPDLSWSASDTVSVKLCVNE